MTASCFTGFFPCQLQTFGQVSKFFHRHFEVYFMPSLCVAMPAGSVVTFNSRSTEMIAQAVTFLLAWLAPQGEKALQRCESAKEALNRACQLLSVHGSWSWMPKMACALARTVVGLQSEVARLEGITYRSWDYHRPSKSVLDSIADLSYDTAVLWRSELYAAALFLDDFAAELESKGQHAVWGTIRHAADGTRDLYDLVGVHIARVSPLPGP